MRDQLAARDHGTPRRPLHPSTSSCILRLGTLSPLVEVVYFHGDFCSSGACVVPDNDDGVLLSVTLSGVDWRNFE